MSIEVLFNVVRQLAILVICSTNGRHSWMNLSYGLYDQKWLRRLIEKHKSSTGRV